jgi:hypothetical protein
MKLLQARTRRTTSVSAAIAKWTIVLLLLLLGIAALVFRSTGQSQRIPLGDGSEIRVLQVTYGTDHQYRKLSRLSRWVRQGLSYIHVAKGSPEADVSGLSTSTPSISIWWGWFEKGKDVPDVVPVDRTWMILDSGERIQLGWIFKPEDLRQILVEDPPLHSKTLRFQTVVNYQPVLFSVANPAYVKQRDPQHSDARESFVNSFDMPIEIEGEQQSFFRGLCIRVIESKRISSSDSYQIDYLVINHSPVDLLVEDESGTRTAASDTRPHPTDLRFDHSRYALLRKPEVPLRSVALSETVVAAVEQADADKRPQCKIKVRGLFRDSGQAFNGSISIIPQ